VARARSRRLARFHALRVREANLIKLSPHEIIANGTDWRFFDALKRELKT